MITHTIRYRALFFLIKNLQLKQYTKKRDLQNRLQIPFNLMYERLRITPA